MDRKMLPAFRQYGLRFTWGGRCELFTKVVFPTLVAYQLAIVVASYINGLSQSAHPCATEPYLMKDACDLYMKCEAEKVCVMQLGYDHNADQSICGLTVRFPISWWGPRSEKTSSWRQRNI